MPNIAMYCKTPMSNDGVSFREVHVVQAAKSEAFSILQQEPLCLEVKTMLSCILFPFLGLPD